MNHGEIQWEQKGWIVPADVKGMAAPLVLSVLAHFVIAAVIVVALVGRPMPYEGAPAVTDPILVDLAFVEAPEVPRPTVPVQTVVKDPEARAEAVADTSKEARAVASSVVASAQDLWRPLDPAKIRAADLERLMREAECPRFYRPEDKNVKTKCSGRDTGLGPVDAVRQAQVAAKLATGRDREAIRHGWVIASLPKPPAQMSAALEVSKRTPGEEVFGPWPWDVGR